MNNIPKLLNQKSTTVPVRAIVLFQTAVVSGLAVFLIFQISTLQKKRSLSSGNVAGVSVEHISVPQTITITIDDTTAQFRTQDYNFELKPIFEPTPTKTWFGQITSKITGAQTTDPKIKDYYISFDDAKIEYWLNDNFGKLQTGEKRKATIELTPDPKSKQYQIVKSCTPGRSAAQVPSAQIIKILKDAKQVKPVLTFETTKDTMSPEEEKINETCNEIERLQKIINQVEIPNFENASKLDTFEFVSKENMKNVFEIKIDQEESLYLSIKNSQAFENELKELKALVDIESQNNDYRIANNTLYLLANFEPGRYLNITDTVEEVEKQLKTPTKNLKEIPLEFEEIKEEVDFDQDQVKRFPVLMSESVTEFELTPVDRANRIKNSLSTIEAFVIKPGEEFSFVDTFGSTPGSGATPQSFVYNQELHTYYPEHTIVATSIYRAVLSSELEILERSEILPKIENFGMMKSGDDYLATNIIMHQEVENEDIKSAPAKDFKFKNTTPKEILLVYTYTVKDKSKVSIKIEIYSQDGYKPPKPETGNITQTSFLSDSNSGTLEQFERNGATNTTRYVN